MLNLLINKLFNHQSLTVEESYAAANTILSTASEVEIAAFLTLLSAKGETVDELLGFHQAIKEHAKTLQIDRPLLDIVGTGCDYSGSVNISTASALLSAACGVAVVKHGNVAVTSLAGSANVLEALGFTINQTVDEIITSLDRSNFGFCYAHNFHSVLAKVRGVRKQLNFPTIFNLLGPILNPANAEYIILGAYNQAKADLIAQVLFKLGQVKCAIVFHGNGLDEISCIGKITAKMVTPRGIDDFIIDPEFLGLKKCTPADLAGGDAIHNAGLIRQALSIEGNAITDTLVLNAALALFITQKAFSLKDAVKMVKERISQGNVLPRNRLYEILERKRRPQRKRKSFKAALLSKADGAVISEIKRASPSAGKIAAIVDPVARAKEYVAAGAAAVSVLTDEGFEGSMADLSAVAAALKDTNAAILCKDFFLCSEQIAEAAAAGADAILLMVSALHDKTADLVKVAHAFGLETLVEVHHPSELAIALASGGDVIGINQRDLTDFSMHPDMFERLVREIPSSYVKVAESGIESAIDAKQAFALGFNAVLVGTALSKLDNVNDFFSALK